MYDCSFFEWGNTGGVPVAVRKRPKVTLKVKLPLHYFLKLSDYSLELFIHLGSNRIEGWVAADN